MNSDIAPPILSWPYDTATFGLIYRRYISMVLRRTRTVLKEPTLAEDAAQETFVRFISYAQRHEVRHAAAFLYQIATRVSIEKLRSQSRRGVATELNEEMMTRGEWALEERLALTKVLAMTDEETAQIATLYYMDGMSQDEISAVMSIPRRTISGHLQRFCERAWRLLRDRDEVGGASMVPPAALEKEKVYDHE